MLALFRIDLDILGQFRPVCYRIGQSR